LIVPKNLGNPPSNAHAYRLYIFNEPDSTSAQAPPPFAFV
jgi:hypothetical protein